MKNFALSIILIGSLALCACSGNKANNETQEENTEHFDSLRTAIAEKDSLMALFSESNKYLATWRSFSKLWPTVANASTLLKPVYASQATILMR